MRGAGEAGECNGRHGGVGEERTGGNSVIQPPCFVIRREKFVHVTRNVLLSITHIIYNELEEEEEEKESSLSMDRLRRQNYGVLGKQIKKHTFYVCALMSVKEDQLEQKGEEEKGGSKKSKWRD